MMKQFLHSGPGLVIGIPTLGRPVPLDWALALKSMNTPINFNVNFHLVKDQAVDLARNQIAKFALEHDAKYLFFLGDDVVCPGHTLRQLIYRMEQDDSIGVVGGVYCNKSDPPAPLVFRGNGQGSYWDWKVGEFFEVTGLGLDCNLIRVDLLRDLKSDWFKTVDEDDYADGKNKAETWTEDLFFFKRVAEETSYKIFCDASIICDHWDVYGGKSYTLPLDSLPRRRKIVTKDKKCLMIGAPLVIQDIEKDSFDVTYASSHESADYRVQSSCLPFDSDTFDWVLVNDPLFNTDVSEYRRVVKRDGKITIKLHDLVDKEKFMCLVGGTHDGPFVEVKKEWLSLATQSGK